MMRKNEVGLRFPCECVSIHSHYSDPWAAITQRKLLNDGTKERILNCLARQPQTIARLAKELGLSQPAIHGHITDMLRSELLRGAARPKKKHPAENYYELNFPVIKAADRAAFETVCRTMAQQIAQFFEKKQGEMERLARTATFAEQGCNFSDVAHFFYTRTYREARKLLEERGVLPSPSRHVNGAEWVFWAEE